MLHVGTGPFERTVTSPPRSKSHAARLLVLAALDPRTAVVRGVPDAADTRDLVRCLGRAGLAVSPRGGDAVVAGSFPACEGDGGRRTDPLVLPTGEGGTTNRFLAALLALGRRRYVLEPSGRMRVRPMGDLLSALAALGARVRRTEGGAVEVQGPVRAGPGALVRVDCSRTTQPASGLMLALSGTGARVVPERAGPSRSWLDATRDAVERWGRLARDRRAPAATVPTDLAGLAGPMALAATRGSLLATGIEWPDGGPPSADRPPRGDAALVGVLGAMGAAVAARGDRLSVRQAPLRAVRLDCSDLLDCVPTLAYLCSRAEGTSVLGGLATLRHKESDRAAATGGLLTLFGTRHRWSPGKGSLAITGPSPPARGTVARPPPDHRMVMAAYLFLRGGGGGRLHGEGAVRKSFPGFFDAVGERGRGVTA